MKETVTESYILFPDPELAWCEKQLTVINWLEDILKGTFSKACTYWRLIYSNFSFQTFRQVTCHAGFLKWYGSASKSDPSFPLSCCFQVCSVYSFSPWKQVNSFRIVRITVTLQFMYRVLLESQILTPRVQTFF